MIKKIALKGISRSPSDRMTEEGGVAESLNVHIEDGENAPDLTPEDIASRYGAGDLTDGDFLFIHKGTYYENLIYLSGLTIKASSTTLGQVALCTLESGETIVDVTSIGNTLVISTSEHMYYNLFRDGSYKFLGTQVPVPEIEFRCIEHDNYERLTGIPHVATLVEGGTKDDEGYDPIYAFDEEAWRQYLASEYHDETVKASAEAVATKLWELLAQQVKAIKDKGYMATPVFARYAVRLYDGTYIYQSVPILLGAGAASFFDAKGIVVTPGAYISFLTDNDPWELVNSLDNILHDMAGDNKYYSFLFAKLKRVYKATAHLIEFDYAGWEDIIESVDIFLSTDVHYPLLNSKITKLGNIDSSWDSSQKSGGVSLSVKTGSTGPRGSNVGVSSNVKRSGASSSVVNDNNAVYDLGFDTDKSTDEIQEQIEEELISKDVFYKLASFDLESLDKLQAADGYDLMTDRKFASQDYLVTQDTMPDDFESYHEKTPIALFRYNKSLMMGGLKEKLPRGYMFLNGTMLPYNDDEDVQTEKTYEFKFRVRKNGKEHDVMAHFYNDRYEFQTRYSRTMDTSKVVRHTGAIATLTVTQSASSSGGGGSESGSSGTITITENSLSFPASGGSKTFHVVASDTTTPWAYSISGLAGVTVSGIDEYDQYGSKEITVTAAASAAAQSGTIAIYPINSKSTADTTKSDYDSITIEQTAPATCQIDGGNAFGADGGSTYIDITDTANVGWTLETNSSWIHLQYTAGGSTPETVRVDVDAMSEEGTRSGTIIFRSDDGVSTIRMTITQKVIATVPFLFPASLVIPSMSYVENYALFITNPDDEGFSIECSADWIDTSWFVGTHTKGAGNLKPYYTLSVEENTTGADRSADIMLKDSVGNLIQTVTVKQLAADKPFAGQSQFLMSGVSGTIHVHADGIWYLYLPEASDGLVIGDSHPTKSGKGDDHISLTPSTDDSYQYRVGPSLIKFVTGGAVVNGIFVRRENAGSDAYTGHIMPECMYVGAEGTTERILVIDNSKSGWVLTEPSGVALSASSGTGTSNVVLTVKANTTGAERTLTVQRKDGSGTVLDELTIVQGA